MHLSDLDATATAELVRTGQVSPRELVDQAIDRIERHNPQLGAVIIPLYDRARRAAAQPHEVVLVQLEPGKTMADLAKWAGEMKGPPPGKPVGGIPAFMKGKTAYFDADLTPGDYGMICFVPDVKDGKMHAQHGMMTQFKIS